MSNQPPVYPTIRFLVAKGDLLAVLAALIPVLLGFWGLASGFSWVWMAFAIVVGTGLWLILRSYVEVLRILSDTLMPR
ncbi:hypothetical protein ACFO1V_02505 [Daeguia caeni]|uniref:DUF4175 domain-containing protein n=1 Tax=Daeguia caeni TaxID=439612 RepID=A0ABV9H133_9HYPH